MQSKSRAYIQLFIIVVQEDKLRVGPRNMLHHQVVAEVVTVKDWHREKNTEIPKVCSIQPDILKNE